jgi:hypothetical protein
VVQQQRLARFSFQFAAAQQGADVAVADFIELFGNRRQAARFEDPTTMQALRCFSGLPLFTLNSMHYAPES